MPPLLCISEELNVKALCHVGDLGMPVFKLLGRREIEPWSPISAKKADKNPVPEERNRVGDVPSPKEPQLF